MKIADMLPHGVANAIPSAELVARCGFRNTRELQQTIERERLRGEIIASTGRNGGGYFIPATTAELREYVNTVRKRAINTLRSVAPAYRALRATEKPPAATGGAQE
jgi:hypothetical protein